MMIDDWRLMIGRNRTIDGITGGTGKVETGGVSRPCKGLIRQLHRSSLGTGGLRTDPGGALLKYRSVALREREAD